MFAFFIVPKSSPLNVQGVVQVPHWHWNKIRHKKQRTEYIRMSRYYALKDRRELVPRDEDVQALRGKMQRYAGFIAYICNYIYIYL